MKQDGANVLYFFGMTCFVPFLTVFVLFYWSMSQFIPVLVRFCFLCSVQFRTNRYISTYKYIGQTGIYGVIDFIY